VYGPMGIFFGPLIVALILAFVQIYGRNTRSVCARTNRQAVKSRKSLLGTLAILAGCSLGPSYIVKDFRPPQALAVLPSRTRPTTSKPRLGPQGPAGNPPPPGVSPVNAEKIDSILKEKFGITDGGQLGSAAPQDLGKASMRTGSSTAMSSHFRTSPGVCPQEDRQGIPQDFGPQNRRASLEDQKGWTTPEIQINPDEARRTAARQIIDRQKRRLDGRSCGKRPS